MRMKELLLLQFYFLNYINANQDTHSYHQPVQIDVNLLQNLNSKENSENNIHHYDNFNHNYEDLNIDYDYFSMLEDNSPQFNAALENIQLKASYKNEMKNSELKDISYSEKENYNVDMNALLSLVQSHNLDSKAISEFLKLEPNSKPAEKPNKNLQVFYDPEPSRNYQTKAPTPKHRLDLSRPPFIIQTTTKRQTTTRPTTTSTTTMAPTTEKKKINSPSPNQYPIINSNKSPNKVKFHINSIFSQSNGKLSPKLMRQLEEILPIIFQKLKIPEKLSTKILSSKEILHGIILEMVSDENVENALEMMNELPGIEQIPDFLRNINMSSISNVIKDTDLQFISALLETLGVDTEYFTGVFSRVGATSPDFDKEGDTQSKFLYLPLVDASSVSNVQVLGFTVLLFFLLATYIVYIEYKIPLPKLIDYKDLGKNKYKIPMETVIDYAETLYTPPEKYPRIPTKKNTQPPKIYKAPIIVQGFPSGYISPPSYKTTSKRNKYKLVTPPIMRYKSPAPVEPYKPQPIMHYKSPAPVEQYKPQPIITRQIPTYSFLGDDPYKSQVQSQIRRHYDVRDDHYSINDSPHFILSNKPLIVQTKTQEEPKKHFYNRYPQPVEKYSYEIDDNPMIPETIKPFLSNSHSVTYTDPYRLIETNNRPSNQKKNRNDFYPSYKYEDDFNINTFNSENEYSQNNEDRNRLIYSPASVLPPQYNPRIETTTKRAIAYDENKYNSRYVNNDNNVQSYAYDNNKFLSSGYLDPNKLSYSELYLNSNMNKAETTTRFTPPYSYFNPQDYYNRETKKPIEKVYSQKPTTTVSTTPPSTFKVTTIRPTSYRPTSKYADFDFTKVENRK